MVSSASSPKLVAHRDGGKDPDGMIDNRPGIAYPKLRGRKSPIALKNRTADDARRCPKHGNDVVQKMGGHSRSTKNLLGPEKTCRTIRRSMLGPLGPIRRRATCEECNATLVEGGCPECSK